MAQEDIKIIMDMVTGKFGTCIKNFINYFRSLNIVGFEVFTAVVMKNIISGI
jgi:hypothetical protein